MITLNQPMIKELSLAVIFGLLIGLGLTGTIYFLKKNNNNSQHTANFVIPTTAPETNSSTSPTPTPPTSSPNLEITSPQNNDIISTSKSTLKGRTVANSLIIVITPQKNYHLTADSQGNFSLSLDLEPGYNHINISAIDQNDQESHAEIFLTYSTTKLE